MTQAAAFYNTLLDQEDPGLIIECLNGYRIKEAMPDNLADMRLPLGVPEVIREGKDLTLVTYGSCCRIAMDAADALAKHSIELEIIDCRTLLPFDVQSLIALSLKKTNRLVVLDEDVPGGASAYILQEILERQDGYHLLDSAPRTITAQPHRPAYGSDGDYFSKSNAEDVIQTVLELMREAAPSRF
jgi:pyruvate/2-oxoglutarate/acetoin dehydrogenase E1 component